MAEEGKKAKQSDDSNGNRNRFGCFIESLYENLKQGEFESERINEYTADCVKPPKQDVERNNSKG